MTNQNKKFMLNVLMHRRKNEKNFQKRQSISMKKTNLRKKRVESLNLPKKTIYYKIEKKNEQELFCPFFFYTNISSLLKNNHLKSAVAEEKASSMQRSIH